MNTLVEFDDSAADDKETASLRELLKFMERPQSIGIDSLKESLRNIVTLMLAIKGYETGFDLQHLLYGEHSSLAPEGVLKIDKERKRRIQQFWDDINEIEREMALHFHSLFTETAEKIVEIKQEINEKIDLIDDVIDEKEQALEQADTNLEKAVIAQEILKKKQKREKLKEYKNHIKEQETQLQEAKSTQEVLGIQKNVIESHDDLKAKRFDPNKGRSNPLSVLGDVLNMRNAGNDSIYDACNDEEVIANSSDSTTDTTDGEGDSEGGSKEEDTKPPPPTINI